MKINTDDMVIYGGERNTELAVERGESLRELTEDQALALLKLDAAGRRGLLRTWDEAAVENLQEGD